MANTYSYTGPGTRWAAEDATAEDFLNVSRVNANHLHEALNVLMDTDAATGLLAGVGGVSAGDAMTWPSSVETGQNAHRVLFVDLDDTTVLWDLQAFTEQMQATSWHAELGDPPMHGSMWLTEDQAHIVWWNRETNEQYMLFDSLAGGGKSMINSPTGSVVQDIFFLDGILYYGDTNVGGGLGCVALIDFLRDQMHYYGTSGLHTFGHDIAGRNHNGTDRRAQLASSPGIVNSVVRHVAACRDPGMVDEFGRPIHWWTVGTGAGHSVYNPVENAIYDHSTGPHLGNILSSNGEIARVVDSTHDWHDFRGTVFGISADSYMPPTFQYWSSGTHHFPWASNTTTSLALLEGRSWAQAGAPQYWVGSDQGALVHHISRMDDGGAGTFTDAATIRLHEDYASPYMKGDIRAAWPLHSTADVSTKGHTLTNNNSVTFSDGGPAGSYANFTAASSMSLTLGDHADLTLAGDINVTGWLYRDIDSGAVEGICGQADNASGGDSIWKVFINASDQLTFQVHNDTEGQVVLTAGLSIATGKWYHFCGQVDSTATLMRLYANGVLVASNVAGSNDGAGNNSTEDLIIGGQTTGNTPTLFFDGRIAGVALSATLMTEREIKAEYARGIRRLNSTIDANDTISDNDVIAIAADPHGRFVAVMGVDKVVRIFDEFVVPIATDTYPGTTANDVVIKSVPGGYDPHYIMAGSDQIELVQPNTRVPV